MPNNRAMSVAVFIYTEIYCRYLAPGECIVQDRGEFCNTVTKILAEEYNVPIRVISAGRPQGNGQAESKVKSLKNKMYSLMVEGGSHCLPDNWDETILHRALQIMRSDPAVATGVSPMELILGRQPVFPIEFEHNAVDFTGTELTKPLVDALAKIHDTAFGKASKKIKKEQERYARAYDVRYKTNPLKLRIGMKVQVKKLKTKRAKAHGPTLWQPFKTFYYIHSMDTKKGLVYVRNVGGRVLKKSFAIHCLRLWGGK